MPRRKVRRKFPWASLSDDELLKVRLKDLKVTVEGTWLEKCLHRLYGELADHGIRVRPHAWISLRFHRLLRGVTNVVSAQDGSGSPARPPPSGLGAPGLALSGLGPPGLALPGLGPELAPPARFNSNTRTAPPGNPPHCNAFYGARGF